MKKKTINKVMILVVAGIAVFLSALTVASMTMEKPKTASQVETVEVEKGNVAEELDATGTVESRNKKVFFSPVNATVKKLNFEAGDSVRKGQQLVTYDLEDLEKENQKALLNVKSGRLDLEDAVNQSEEALEKQSEAKANVQTLEGQVDEWQQYVYDLQAAIQQRTTDAQNQAAAQASASAQEAAKAAQKAYQQQLKEYQESEKKLRDIRDKALTAYNQAKNEYDMAMETWKKNASEPNQEALLEKEKARTQAELAYKAAGGLWAADAAGHGGADRGGRIHRSVRGICGHFGSAKGAGQRIRHAGRTAKRTGFGKSRCRGRSRFPERGSKGEDGGGKQPD